MGQELNQLIKYNIYSVSLRRSFLCILTLNLLLSLLGCGSSTNPRSEALKAMGFSDQPYIQDEFKIHMQTFKQEAAKRGVSVDDSELTIIFKDSIQTDLLGNCQKSYQFIEIPKTTWMRIGLYEQEKILFHELGHCLLDRVNHRDEKIHVNGNNVNVSIMATTSSTYYNKESRQYYLDELFDEAKSTDLTLAFIERNKFLLSKDKYSVASKANVENMPMLIYVDSSGNTQAVDPSVCTVISVTNDLNHSVGSDPSIVEATEKIGLVFHQSGNYIVNFSCSGDTFTEKFSIKE